jgi:hypothetical protein
MAINKEKFEGLDDTQKLRYEKINDDVFALREETSKIDKDKTNEFRTNNIAQAEKIKELTSKLEGLAKVEEDNQAKTKANETQAEKLNRLESKLEEITLQGQKSAREATELKTNKGFNEALSSIQGLGDGAGKFISATYGNGLALENGQVVKNENGVLTPVKEYIEGLDKAGSFDMLKKQSNGGGANGGQQTNNTTFSGMTIDEQAKGGN